MIGIRITCIPSLSNLKLFNVLLLLLLRSRYCVRAWHLLVCALICLLENDILWLRLILLLPRVDVS